MADYHDIYPEVPPGATATRWHYPPSSTLVKAIRWHAVRGRGVVGASKILEVVMHGGATYEYSGVPYSVAMSTMFANSRGQAYNAFIKGRYPFKKTSGPTPDGVEMDYEHRVIKGRAL